MPAKGARCLTWDCPRKPWTVAGMGSGLPGAGQGRGSPGGCAGEVREGVEEGQEAGILDEVWLSRPGAGTTPSARRAAHPLSSSGYFLGALMTP